MNHQEHTMNGITPEEHAELQRLIDEQFPRADDLRLSDGSSPNDDWPLLFVAAVATVVVIAVSKFYPMGWF